VWGILNLGTVGGEWSISSLHLLYHRGKSSFMCVRRLDGYKTALYIVAKTRISLRESNSDRPTPRVAKPLYSQFITDEEFVLIFLNSRWFH
jgi:hypothetical protein